jgi:hypothetical protein
LPKGLWLPVDGIHGPMISKQYVLSSVLTGPPRCAA